MPRRGIFAALLLVGIGVVLGTTVFRDDIAQATGLAPAPQSVTVVNTSTSPVPVREQNLDGSGNVKVHEQGTATVNVTNTVPVANVDLPPADRFEFSLSMQNDTC